MRGDHDQQLSGNKDYTPLFEDLVNTTGELSPKTKLLFATNHERIFEAIKRAFPETEQS